MERSIAAALFVVCFALAVDALYAQPPWGDGPPPRMRQGGSPFGGERNRQGGEPGGGQFQPNDANRNARRIAMLKGMDSNQNGTLEANEVPEYRRDFVNRIVTELGGNPQGTLNLNELERKAAAQTPATANQPAAASPSGKTIPVITGDPLVQPFGEKTETPGTVLTFGQREKTAAAAAAAQPAPAVSASDQILRNAKGILTKFDKNRNGTLDKDKSEWSSALPFKAEDADKNLDGRITLSEIVAVSGGKTTATSGSAATAVKRSEAYDQLPQGVPAWFFERDKDKDAQLTMTEYAAGNRWTDALAKEFRFLDKNNDGFATVTEIFAVLKQIDEEKALAADKAKREAARTSGQAAASTATPAEKPAEANVVPAANNAAAQTVPQNAPYAAGSQSSTRSNTSIRPSERSRSGQSRRR
ncbi:MAG: hypothetical protein LBT89_05915 [Planctomycetaceae bacterium]|jgi:Ca2+-binding EF-hand superfamily protein|nr:hypothetical protein [Planctomycetaceae bacterium]